MACVKDGPRCKETTARVQDCCRDKVKEILVNTIRAFNENGIRYWLDYGTLLGAVREGGYIPHDEDADLSFYLQDASLVKNVLDSLCKSEDYSLRSAFEGTGFQLLYSDKNMSHIDLFGWVPNGRVLERTFYVSGTDDRKGKGFPIKWVQPLDKMMFLGVECSIPNEPTLMCEFRYGPTWSRPMRIPEFNRIGGWANGPKGERFA